MKYVVLIETFSHQYKRNEYGDEVSQASRIAKVWFPCVDHDDAQAVAAGVRNVDGNDEWHREATACVEFFVWQPGEIVRIPLDEFKRAANEVCGPLAYDADVRDLVCAIAQHRTIDAIKTFRSLTGESLYEAKRAIDAAIQGNNPDAAAAE